ncbi:MAG: tetratricopeptide repeat protein [Delftia tsuruhatensis]
MLNSKRNAGGSERPVTVPFWLIVLLAVLIGGALWMLFPKQDLERRLSVTGDDSELSYNYLSNLLKSDPGNENLRALLKAKEERLKAIKLAREEAAKQALPSAAVQAWERWQAAYQNYLEAQKQDHRAGGQADALALQVMQALKAVPLAGLTQEQALYLASSALVLKDAPLALGIYDDVAARQGDPARKAQVYESAARQALGMSLYEESARLLRQASATTEDVQQSRAYLWQALQVLQSGNRASEALALARQQEELLGSDPETLRRLIGLARAAGNRAEAERYAKRLLQLSLLQQWQVQAAGASGAGPAVASAVADDGAWALQPVAWTAPGWRMLRTADPARKPPPGLPFDDKTYQLGYEVFLENRNLEDAWRVATAAVRQAPQDMAWRERLAQVSEWMGQQQQALDNWLVIAQNTGREDAWKTVMRLAPGLFDDRALIAGLRHQLSHRPQDAALLQALVQAYERQAEPGAAIDYLQKHGSTPQSQILLAQLAERAGRSPLALQAWKRVLSDPEQRTPAHVMPAAVLALLQGEPALGLRWLEDAQTRVPAGMQDEGEYWRLLGDLAQDQRQEALTLKAYRRLLQTPHAGISDYDEVIRLLQRTDRREAAQMSLHAWEQFQDVRHLTQAFYLLEDQEDWTQIGRQVERIMADPALLKRLMGQPTFFQILGAYYQRTAQPKKAMEAFEKGLALDPGSTPLRQGLMWLLIDTQNAAALKLLLAAAEPVWARDADMHGALAAAYMTLSRPAVALERYLKPHRTEHADDFLWMMQYADALEQNQQADQAWNLRQQLWQREKARTRAQQGPSADAARRWLTAEGLDEVQRQARSRLMLFHTQGDAEFALMRELLRMDLQGGRREHSAAAAELAIAWLQERGEYQAERGYLWQQYARSRSKSASAPLWAEITVALAEKDVAQAGQLLQRHDEALPRYDRINAAAMVGDVRLAQTAGFESMAYQPDDDPLHLGLTEQLLAFSDYGGLQLRNRRMDAIDEQVSRLRWHVGLNPRWALDLDAEDVRRTVNKSTLVRGPSQERGIGLRLTRKTQSASSEFMLGRRESLESYTPMQFTQTYNVDSRWSLQASLGRHLATQETLAMRMGGMKDRVSLGSSYQLSRLDQITLELASERYRVQSGARVGSGNHAMLQYLHTYRSEAPTLQFGAFTSWHRYSRTDPALLQGRDAAILGYLPAFNDPTIDYLLPRSFRFSGLQMMFNTGYEQQYTRALRPYASLALTHHSINGAGYELGMGLATSLFGADHLALGLNLSKSGINTVGNTRELLLTYRLHY